MSNLNNPNLEPFLRKFDAQIVSKEPTATESFIEKVDAEVVEDQQTTKPQKKPKGEVAVESLIRPRKDKLVQIIGDIYDFKLNTITGKIELNGKPISGNFLTTFYLELAEKNRLDIKEANARNVVVLLSERNKYNPVENYLNGCNDPLPEDIWNNIAFHIFGSKNPQHSVHFQRQMIAAVARTYKQPCKVDTALILQTDSQGEGKEAIWEALGGEWYCSSLGSIGGNNHKDTLITLHSAWFHNWGEIDRIMGMQSSENIKHFMSEQKDNFRYPHEKTNSLKDRKCILVGTTNKRNFIKDPTGNRRFPIISANKINADWVLEHRDQIFASAKNDYLDGVRWWYDKKEIVDLNNQAMQFAAHDPLLEEMEEALDTYKRDDICIRVVVDLLNEGLIASEKKEKAKDAKYTRAIATRLQQLGWIKGERARFELEDTTKTEKTSIYRRLPQTATDNATD
jgi:predicted P-loop ATPase